MHTQKSSFQYTQFKGVVTMSLMDGLLLLLFNTVICISLPKVLTLLASNRTRQSESLSD